jgi:hypothetical protein
MVRLICELCHERIHGLDAVRAHIAGHRLLGDHYQVVIASVPHGLVLKSTLMPTALEAAERRWLRK